MKLTPPDAPQDSADAASLSKVPAASLRLITLSKRADFQRATRAVHTAAPGFVVQMRRRKEGETAVPEVIRVGYTCSKKVGNAVARNRAKRRLREIARLTLPKLGMPGHDYVLIGRKSTTATIPFEELLSDFARALAILHGKKT